jgi:hypothetical protein
MQAVPAQLPMASPFGNRKVARQSGMQKMLEEPEAANKM